MPNRATKAILRLDIRNALARPKGSEDGQLGIAPPHGVSQAQLESRFSFALNVGGGGETCRRRHAKGGNGGGYTHDFDKVTLA